MEIKTILGWKKNKMRTKHKGFTLIECLLSLMILSSLLLLFSALINNIAVTTRYLKYTEEKEWQIFLIQIENELTDCTYESTTSNKITLKNKKNNHTVLIENKLQKIVKVDNGGFHPLLINIKQALFSDKGNYIKMEVTFMNNRSYSGKWIIRKG